MASEDQELNVIEELLTQAAAAEGPAEDDENLDSDVGAEEPEAKAEETGADETEPNIEIEDPSADSEESVAPMESVSGDSTAADTEPTDAEEAEEKATKQPRFTSTAKDPAEAVADIAAQVMANVASLTERAEANPPMQALEGTAGEEAEFPAETMVKPSEAPDIEPIEERYWYVVHCYSGYENKVKGNLEQRIETMDMQNEIFQVVVPTEDEIEVRDGERKTIERRVFPGYILVQMKLDDDSWYVVRNTPGVTGFVGMGNEPTPLHAEEVQSILRRMEAEAPKIKVSFKPGQKVRIIDGPFNEFIGIVDEIDMDRAKVRVLVSFFGRETPVELDFLQVEKI